MNPTSSPLVGNRQDDIKQALKRCKPEAIAAALRFQQTRSIADVQPVILGLIEREMPEDSAQDIATAPGDTRLIEDLGLDSLGLMEAVMAAEEVFGITIENQDLRRIATLEELNGFVEAKLATAA